MSGGGHFSCPNGLTYFIHSSHESIGDFIQFNKAFPKVHSYILLSEIISLFYIS